MKTEEIGSALRRARTEAGMTQQALATAAKVPQPTIARIERGTVTPRAATLIALLHAAGHELAVRPIHPESGD